MGRYSSTTSRESNIELYRILVMLLIIVHHYVVNSGLLNKMSLEPLAFNSLYLYILGMWGKTGINCFVLITGYFMCCRKTTLRKFLKLLLEIEFYNVIIHLVFTIAGYQPFSFIGTALAFFPIKGISTDFASCYIVFYLFIPFLNLLLDSIDKRKLKLLIVLCLFTFSFLKVCPFYKVDINYVLWFCVLYLMGAYIRKYPWRNNENTNHWIKLLILSVFLSISSVIVLLWLQTKEVPFKDMFFFVSDSNAPLAIFTAICMFMLFKSIRIPRNRIINVLGGGTFGVLLIHANCPAMRNWLWHDVFCNTDYYGTDAIYLHAFIVPTIVFIICSFIEYARSKSIEKPLIDLTYALLERIKWRF